MLASVVGGARTRPTIAAYHEGMPAGVGPDDTVLRVSRTLALPMTEIQWRATTSGGPGGQHANRTLSRVEVTFNVERSATLGPRQRARLLDKIGPVVRASSGDERSQARNRQIALERLATRIASALHTDKSRHATAPTKGAKERRLASKHRRSALKALREGRDLGDD
jgi:ribosome-associated protein